ANNPRWFLPPLPRFRTHRWPDITPGNAVSTEWRNTSEGTLTEVRSARADVTALHATATGGAFYTVGEAASFLRVSTVTLGRWRIEGRGPPFRKFGRRVAYALSDLLSWADPQGRTSTSEAGGSNGRGLSI